MPNYGLANRRAGLRKQLSDAQPSPGPLTMPVGNEPVYPGMPLHQAQQQTMQERSALNQGMQSRLGAYRSTSFAPTMQGVPAPMPRLGLNGFVPEQQTFAAHQLGQPYQNIPQALPGNPAYTPPPANPIVPAGGPLFGQGQRDAGVTRDAYGFAAGRPFSRQNFQPEMPESVAAGGAPGILGSIGNSTVFRRPGEMQPGVAGSQMSLMGGTAAREYNSAIQGGESSKTALRQTMRDAQERYRQSPQFQAQVAREQQKNAVTRAKNADLRGLAQARRLGVEPNKEMLGRLGGNGLAGANTGFGGNISGEQFSKLMDPKAQESHKGVFGFRPNEQSSYTHTADVMKGIEQRFPHFDNAGKREYAAAVRAATLSPRFQANTDAGKKILGWLAKNGGGAPIAGKAQGGAQASVPPQVPKKQKPKGDSGMTAYAGAGGA